METSSSSFSDLESLPPEVFKKINKKLSPKSAGKLAQSSKSMRKYVGEYKVRDVDPNIYGGKYLDRAIKEKNLGQLKYWLNREKKTGKELIKWNKSMIKKIIHDVNIVELFAKYKDISIDNNLAIQMASENGHAEVVKLLLDDKRANPKAEDNWAIQKASQNGHVEVVKLLLNDKRVDPTADNNSAIQYASENGHVEVMKLLLNDKRVDPTEDNNSAI